MLFHRIPRRNLLETFKSLTSPINSNRITPTVSSNPARLYSMEGTEVAPTKPVNKAMKAYLERAREHEVFMEKQKQEYQIGKRHLANMMGENPETFTEEDISNAVDYLFPSGLFDKKARPMMKPPEEIFPQKKAAEFDETGRPYHFLFYTTKPNYYQALYDVVEHMEDLNRFEDSMIRKGNKPDPNLKLELIGYRWIDKESLQNKFMETIGDKDYSMLIDALERLSQHPYSYRIKDHIFGYVHTLISQKKTSEIAPLKYDADGRAYITTYECKRKTAVGDVTIRGPGTGKISINGREITYFEDIQSREQLMFPLEFTGMQNKVDIECNVIGGGPSGQSGALRWGIAWGLRSFVDSEMVERMRLAGLLTRDWRIKERKKPGQAGARRKFTWKKR